MREMSIATLMSQSRRSTLSMRVLGTCLALGAAGVVAGLWYRHKTTPLPYSQRWMLEKDFPYLTRKRLCEVLTPQPGERILEIGPGIGFFSLPVAQRLTPGGMLNVIDIQQVMLEHTLRVAAEQNVSNI